MNIGLYDDVEMNYIIIPVKNKRIEYSATKEISFEQKIKFFQIIQKIHIQSIEENDYISFSFQLHMLRFRY